jgi:hypothetical protein
MFKKTKVAVATVAMLGAVAAPNVSAVALDESGDQAEVLIFPYYNTNNNFQTAFTIRNTKDEYKVVKMRFRESGISNDVLDFNVYLSPFDHFSVTVAKDASGDAVMTTADTTCTYPAIPAAGVKLVHSVYNETSQSDTREGYLEVIEQGLVVDGKVGSVTSNNMYDAIKHVDNGDGTYTPKDCGLIATAWSNGYFTQGGATADPAFAAANAASAIGGMYSDETVGLTDGLPNHIIAPTGGLQGYSVLVDTVKGAAFAADPVMIRNYHTGTSFAQDLNGDGDATDNNVTIGGIAYNEAAAPSGQHYLSDDTTYYLLPSLASGDNPVATVTNNAGTGTVTDTWAVVNADWGLSDPGVAPNTSVPSGVNPMPMADVLAATALTNDYFINPDFDAATDWVVTFPMRKHGINNGYDYDNQAVAAAHPVNKFSALGSAADADVTMTSKFYNREEAEPAPGQAGFSPAVQAGKSALTREVNVVTFVNPDNATNTVLGSDHSFFNTLESGFVEGWATISFTNYSLNTRYAIADGTHAEAISTGSGGVGFTAGMWVNNAGAATSAGTGVPAIGFAAIRGNMGPGTSVSLGETIPHTFTRNR